MDDQTAKTLDRITRDFYANNAASFSGTRQSAWPGWERLLPHILPSNDFAILDIGCGNLRFERFMAERLPEKSLCFTAIDRCPELACETPANVDFACADIAAPDAFAHLPEYDLTVSFAVLHHIPTPDAQTRLLRDLILHTKPGSLTCVSFWQFAKDPKLLANAMATTEKATSELGIRLDQSRCDYLLGWQNQPGIYRYCHSFTDDEIAQMTTAACTSGAHLIDAYSADGKTGDLNRYVILQRDVD